MAAATQTERFAAEDDRPVPAEQLPFIVLKTPQGAILGYDMPLCRLDGTTIVQPFQIVPGKVIPGSHVIPLVLQLMEMYHALKARLDGALAERDSEREKRVLAEGSLKALEGKIEGRRRQEKNGGG